MIVIDVPAQEHFVNLLEQQDDNMALRLEVTNPGTPKADCELYFCSDNELKIDDQKIEFANFNLFVDKDSVSFLKDAEISLIKKNLNTELKISAPFIKGNTNKTLYDKIEEFIESDINPALAAHRGMCTLIEITKNNEVVLQFGGGCQGCGMIDVTLKQGIETKLKEIFPEIKAVLDSTDHKSGENPYY